MANTCTIFCSIVLAFFTVFLLCFTIVPYDSYSNLEFIQCNITNIDYPTNLPTEQDSSNWKTCDCGKYCESLYPCVKLYSDEYPNKVINKVFEYNEDTNDCTFYENECKDGENPINTHKYLMEAIGYYEKYINKTVDCYYNPSNDSLYLEKKFDNVFAIVNITVVSVCILYFICKFIHYKYKLHAKSKLKTEPIVIPGSCKFTSHAV